MESGQCDSDPVPNQCLGPGKGGPELGLEDMGIITLHILPEAKIAVVSSHYN